MARADLSRALPRPIVIPGVMNLATLDDARTLIEKHLPAHFRDRPGLASRRRRTGEGRSKRRHRRSVARAADGAVA